MNNILCETAGVFSDKAATLHSISELLESLGVEVDGKIFQSGSLSDLKVSANDYAVLAKLVENPDAFLAELSRIPIEEKPPTVILSPPGSASSMAQAVSAGADAVITEDPNNNNLSSAILFAKANNSAKRQIAKELRKTRRRVVERAEVERAKYFLMLEKGMTESDAHEHLRSTAMESCSSMGQVAIEMLKKLSP